MIKDIQFHKIHNPDELLILTNKVSFNYIFSDSLIALLQKNFNLPDSFYILVKDSEENFIGFCSMDRDWWEDGYFFIREILIDNEFRGNNIGTELFQKCIQYAKDRGANGIVTETDFENTAMQNLCKKLKFTKWKNPHWNDGYTYKLKF